MFRRYLRNEAFKTLYVIFSLTPLPIYATERLPLFSFCLKSHFPEISKKEFGQIPVSQVRSTQNIQIRHWLLFIQNCKFRISILCSLAAFCGHCWPSVEKIFRSSGNIAPELPKQMKIWSRSSDTSAFLCNQQPGRWIHDRIGVSFFFLISNFVVHLVDEF